MTSPPYTTSPVTVEICADSIEGVTIAKGAGADRVELCAALSEGGVTPSLGMIETAQTLLSRGLVVLIRPRPGDLLLSDQDFAVIERDIRAARDLGVDAIAIGFLNMDGTLDREHIARAAELARPLDVTCHRAFDLTRDPEEALETLISLGIDRVLTSGHAPDVESGLQVIQQLVALAGDRITIMPGGGVTEHNLATIIKTTGSREIHFSGSAICKSPMPQHNPRAPLGPSRSLGAHEVRLTDPARLKRMISALHEE